MKDIELMCKSMQELCLMSREEGREEGREEARKEAREEARREGRLELLAGMVKDGMITAQQAAAYARMSVAEFQAAAANLI